MENSLCDGAYLVLAIVGSLEHVIASVSLRDGQLQLGHMSCSWQLPVSGEKAASAGWSLAALWLAADAARQQ